MLSRLEAYYDAVPRSAARAEEHGPFTLFIGEGPWPYYARPRLGAAEFAADEIAVVRARQLELGVPEAFEWVHETTPALLEVVREAGLPVLEAPLMVLEAFNETIAPPSIGVRILAPDDEALAASIAVANVGFGAAGTAAGPQGIAERDAASPQDDLTFRRERLRQRLTVTAVAENAAGPVAVGSHNPAGDVTEVVGVATLPAVRRQGLGGAVTSALVNDARENGAEIVFLSAGSEDISRLYHRLGFRRIGTACIAG